MKLQSKHIQTHKNVPYEYEYEGRIYYRVSELEHVAESSYEAYAVRIADEIDSTTNTVPIYTLRWDAKPLHEIIESVKQCDTVEIYDKKYNISQFPAPKRLIDNNKGKACNGMWYVLEHHDNDNNDYYDHSYNYAYAIRTDEPLNEDDNVVVFEIQYLKKNASESQIQVDNLDVIQDFAVTATCEEGEMYDWEKPNNIFSHGFYSQDCYSLKTQRVLRFGAITKLISRHMIARTALVEYKLKYKNIIHEGDIYIPLMPRIAVDADTVETHAVKIGDEIKKLDDTKVVPHYKMILDNAGAVITITIDGYAIVDGLHPIR